jgi:hypothetical protein
MSLSFNDFIELLLSQMTEKERKEGIAYVAEELLQTGSKIQFNQITLEISTDSYLGFIDREPQANWGHSARYVVVNQKSGKISSLETRLPPFERNSDISWHVIYKAPGVPDVFSEYPR